MAQEMLDTAKSMPGFVDVKAFKADDGERLTLVWWQDEETLRAWRNHAPHLVAQRLGRERWYEYYKIEVCELIRANEFTPDAQRRSIENPPAPRGEPPEASRQDCP